MAIGVFRIYLGCTWTEAAIDRLVRGFDAIPGFLYRIDRALSEPHPAGSEPPSDDARRALIRIAMTQAHALLLLCDADTPLPPEAGLEIDLARRGFRRRLPVIAVAAPDLPSCVLPDGCEARVSWDASEIACAIQQSVEQCVADWRAQSRARLADIPSSAEPAKAVDRISAPSRTDARVSGLPVAEIASAYANLRALRGDPTSTR